MYRIMTNFIKVLTSLACFLSFTNFNFGFDGLQLVREFGAKLCPYTNFCSSEAAKENLDVSLTPCCRPCFCDDDCWELGNCCPDKQGTPPASSDLISCKNKKVKSRRLDKREIRTTNSRYFRVIDTCPWTEDNLTLIGLCMGDNQTVLEDYVWVSDYVKGKIYQNVHCATCHRIDSYVPWQIKTTCADILHGDFVNVEELLLLSHSCDVINEVPNGLESKTVKYECFGNIVPTCSEFPHEQLANHSQDIVAACEHSTWAYFQPLFPSAHRNVFCFICNFGLDMKREDLCKPIDFQTRIDSKDRFSAIINYHERPVKEELTEDSGCHSNEVLDKYMGRCHKLICPFGRVPLFGRCELISSNIDYLYIDIHFYLETRWPQTNLEILNNNAVMGTAVHRQFSQYLGWEEAGCGSRVSKVYAKIANKTVPPASFLVKYRLRTTSTCQPDFIQQQASDILGRMIPINITGDILVVFVRPSKWYKDDTTQMSQIYYYDIVTGAPPAYFTSVILDAEMFCPKIELNLSYVGIFSAVQEKEKHMFLSFFETSDARNDSDTIYVCQEHYFAVMSLTNACLCLKFMEANFFAALIMYTVELQWLEH